MAEYVGLLRGINVSGQKKIKMDELRSKLESLGYQNLRTYIQSGNIVFESTCLDKEQLEAEIHQNILDNFGFDVPVVVRNKAEWQVAFDSNPFLNGRQEDITKLYVAFLQREPAQEAIADLMTKEIFPDEMISVDDRIYFFCPNGAARSNIDNNLIERKLKVKATTRNWKTTTKLLQMLKNEA
ncbi:MAG: DUF1697 domain-containing protein [Reichenbachiella sp.]|uniref:DUF1697 domain-containing protein n=1 Tax=Reichenbachiella sp. TaxID=2184521 RepID=UPI0032668E97